MKKKSRVWVFSPGRKESHEGQFKFISGAVIINFNNLDQHSNVEFPCPVSVKGLRDFIIELIFIINAFCRCSCYIFGYFKSKNTLTFSSLGGGVTFRRYLFNQLLINMIKWNNPPPKKIHW